MYVPFAVFCDAANLSQEGKLNILGMVDAIQVGGFPSLHPRTHFVVRLKAHSDDAGRHVLAFRWLNPAGTELWSSSGEVNIEAGGPPGAEMDVPVIVVLDLPFDRGGPYVMEVIVDDVAQMEVRLHVASSALPPMTPRPTLVS